MTPGYKYVTSHRAMEAAFEPLFRAGHLVHPKGLAPADAAKEATRLIAIHLGAQKDGHATMRAADGVTPIPDEAPSQVDPDDFFS